MPSSANRRLTSPVTASSARPGKPPLPGQPASAGRRWLRPRPSRVRRERPPRRCAASLAPRGPRHQPRGDLHGASVRVSEGTPRGPSRSRAVRRDYLDPLEYDCSVPAWLHGRLHLKSSHPLLAVLLRRRFRFPALLRHALPWMKGGRPSRRQTPGQRRRFRRSPRTARAWPPSGQSVNSRNRWGNSSPCSRTLSPPPARTGCAQKPAPTVIGSSPRRPLPTADHPRTSKPSRRVDVQRRSQVVPRRVHASKSWSPYSTQPRSISSSSSSSSSSPTRSSRSS